MIGGAHAQYASAGVSLDAARSRIDSMLQQDVYNLVKLNMHCIHTHTHAHADWSAIRKENWRYQYITEYSWLKIRQA